MQARHKGLVIALLAMVLLFGIGGWFGFRTGSTEPRSAVMAFDSNAVVLIEFIDFADPGNNLQLSRIDNGWERHSERTMAWPPQEQATHLLKDFHFLPVKRDMGMIGLVGERFDLTSSTMARITFVEENGLTHALNIGRSTFAPGRVGSWTYVNIPGDKLVYAVEGLLTARLRPGSAEL
jgi:hypothetical protein